MDPSLPDVPPKQHHGDYAPKAYRAPAAATADYVVTLDRRQWQALCNAVWTESKGRVSLTALPALMQKWIKDHG
jgi:hypothetical protein